MTLPRKLQYRDRYVYHLTRQIEGDCEGEPILFPDDDTPIKFVVELSQNEFTSILSALMTGADLSYPENSHEVVWRLLRQVECPVSICEEILECLQPAFDEINEKLDDIQETVDEISDAIEENGATEPPPVAANTDPLVCSGAKAVLDAMNIQILAVYAQSESGFFDDATESVAAILSALPVFGQLPFDELILLANNYFESQRDEYTADFTAAYNDMLHDLYCKIIDNDGVFTFEVWAEWTTDLNLRIPDNRASRLIAAYSPVAVTFINQIAAALFGQQSLEDYFRDLYLAYLSGAETPSYLCSDAGCLACGLRYSYNSEHGFEIATGWTATPDPEGWYISGEHTGVPNENWVLGSDETVSGTFTAMHLHVEVAGGEANLNWAIGYYDASHDLVAFTDTSPEITIIDGAGGMVEIILDLLTPTAYTGIHINTNNSFQPPFKVTGLQVCE